MPERLLFSKSQRARYISHLDLMRTFQRAFLRAGVTIRHTEGYNPHPFVSVALPISVGYSSECEILEFGLVSPLSLDEVAWRLNHVLPEGLWVRSCYTAERPLSELKAINYIVNFEYEDGRPLDTEATLTSLLRRKSLVVKKKSNKSKKGYTEVDIIPLIYRWSTECQSDSMTLDVELSAQNPGLNPVYIRNAFVDENPAFVPDLVTYHRREILDANGRIFR